jgi:hypothetical protein
LPIVIFQLKINGVIEPALRTLTLIPYPFEGGLRVKLIANR